MKKFSCLAKTALIISSMLTFLGLTSCSGDIQTVTHEISDDFNDIEAVTTVADIAFLPSDDGKCRVDSSEQEKLSHTVEVVDGVLKIKFSDSRSWFEKILTPNMSVTVYLPKNEYGKIIAKSDVGSITLDGGFSFEAASISCDTGIVTVKDVKCTSFIAELNTGNSLIHGVTSSERMQINTNTGNTIIGACSATELYVKASTGAVNVESTQCAILAVSVDTGDINLIDVIAEGKFDVTSDTGDVKFTACDADSAFITTDTGNVRGSFLTDKIIFTDTKTGKVDTPKLTNGGKCEITTTTGDIKITIN